MGGLATLSDNGQAWFWTRRWQEAEKRADEDIRAGRVYSLPNAEEAIAYLHARVARRETVGEHGDSSREKHCR